MPVLKPVLRPVLTPGGADALGARPGPKARTDIPHRRGGSMVHRVGDGSQQRAKRTPGEPSTLSPRAWAYAVAVVSAAVVSAAVVSVAVVVVAEGVGSAAISVAVSRGVAARAVGRKFVGGGAPWIFVEGKENRRAIPCVWTEDSTPPSAKRPSGTPYRLRAGSTSFGVRGRPSCDPSGATWRRGSCVPGERERSGLANSVENSKPWRCSSRRRAPPGRQSVRVHCWP